MEYGQFFARAMGGHRPFPFQTALAEGAWPDILSVPTGLGKTAAVTLAWLYRRQVREDADMPRRLIWCLPMRVLVEQTHRNIVDWLKALDLYGEAGEADRVAVSLLMGGESDVRQAPWALHPEQDTILIGTQDMLLSRALMRGFGMSRYQWPVHFALLHTDALWVFDEVQLMGPALATTSQLEGLRRTSAYRPVRPARSLWVSATLDRTWLNTVDFKAHAADLQVLELSEDEKGLEAVRRRREAPKLLHLAETRLQATHQTKPGRAAYAKSLADELLSRHVVGKVTLVVVNTVDRAQAVFEALRAGAADSEVILIHGRFRPAERRGIEAGLRESPKDRIIVATQAIEAGVDMTSVVLFTELAPFSSMVQRFGRCNRYGEEFAAEVVWVDCEPDDKLTPPYAPEELETARNWLMTLTGVSASELPPLEEKAKHGLVLRRKDLVELFNTEPDLSGLDVDISPYIRDTGTPQLQVFWRDFGERPDDEGQPSRDELCPVSITQMKDYLGPKRQAFIWDGLAGRWTRMSAQPRPGMTLLLRAADGGYDAQLGFHPLSRSGVAVVGAPVAREESYDGEADTAIGRFVDLPTHLTDVAAEARSLAGLLDLQGASAEALETAARWHDVGKAHPAFQHALLRAGENVPDRPDVLWAKSDGRGRLDFAMPGPEGRLVPRRHFRHELASMLAWIEHGEPGPTHDLIAYLIAAHHGKVRLGLRALPTETVPERDRRFARGVWEGDLLPAVRINGLTVPETVLRLEVMELGLGGQGESWTGRTQRLLEEHGPFRLAWLEALVRIADWRASRAEQERTAGNEM